MQRSLFEREVQTAVCVLDFIEGVEARCGGDAVCEEDGTEALRAACARVADARGRRWLRPVATDCQCAQCTAAAKRRADVEQRPVASGPATSVRARDCVDSARASAVVHPRPRPYCGTTPRGSASPTGLAGGEGGDRVDWDAPRALRSASPVALRRKRRV